LANSKKNSRRDRCPSQSSTIQKSSEFTESDTTGLKISEGGKSHTSWGCSCHYCCWRCLCYVRVSIDNSTYIPS
jgi:hypothetical protein